MPRVTQQAIRQYLLVVGELLDPDELPEKIELFDVDGNPLSIPLGARRDVEIITASLDAAEGAEPDDRVATDGQSGTVVLGPGVMLTHISTSHAARIRLYSSAAKRTADVDRDRETDPMDYPEETPTQDHGCLSEFLLISTLSMTNIPPDYLVSDAGDSDIYYRIDNFDLSAAAITVTLTIKDVEQ